MTRVGFPSLRSVQYLLIESVAPILSNGVSTFYCQVKYHTACAVQSTWFNNKSRFRFSQAHTQTSCFSLCDVPFLNQVARIALNTTSSSFLTPYLSTAPKVVRASKWDAAATNGLLERPFGAPSYVQFAPTNREVSMVNSIHHSNNANRSPISWLPYIYLCLDQDHFQYVCVSR